MKKLSLFLFIFMMITNTVSNCENNTQDILQAIKILKNHLARQPRGFTIKDSSSWSEYHNNQRQEDNLFNALIYAEKTCDCKNDLTLTHDCQQTLLKPLVVAYIEAALKKEDSLESYRYFSPDDQEQHIAYIKYLREQKESFNKHIQAIREC